MLEVTVFRGGTDLRMCKREYLGCVHVLTSLHHVYRLAYPGSSWYSYIFQTILVNISQVRAIRFK